MSEAQTDKGNNSLRKAKYVRDFVHRVEDCSDEATPEPHE
jgi:hypothetical protein